MRLSRALSVHFDLIVATANNGVVVSRSQTLSGIVYTRRPCINNSKKDQSKIIAKFCRNVWNNVIM